MASRNKKPKWETPKFTFSTLKQADECKAFYMCAGNFLEGLNIDTESEDNTRKGLKQLGMMF